MKIYFSNVTNNQYLLHIILSLTLVFALVMTVSCQSQSPAPSPVPPTGGDTPLAPITGEPEPATPLQIEVAIEGSAFNPAVLPAPPPASSSLPPNAPAPAPAPNLPVGTTILWYNIDSVDHTVTARDNSFDSGSISPNETFKYTFQEPGEFEYYCKIHPSMVGKITIE
ncbi:plastocyanin/azurin family copper-binding protein [Chloroflexota bacterium]